MVYYSSIINCKNDPNKAHAMTTKDDNNINDITKSYNDNKKKISNTIMKKKKEVLNYKIIREYKNLFSCSELMERIIKYHYVVHKNTEIKIDTVTNKLPNNK
jgi:cytoplasmic iron level regulating protein YaaA (DUF328/UPF0246 family)